MFKKYVYKQKYSMTIAHFCPPPPRKPPPPFSLIHGGKNFLPTRKPRSFAWKGKKKTTWRRWGRREKKVGSMKRKEC